MIPVEDLLKYGAKIKSFKKGDILFHKGDMARYYYQIIMGEVKMNNYNEKGKEFVQGIFRQQQSFGEPPLFIDKLYPANAVTSKDSEVLLLEKHKFYELLDNEPHIAMKFAKVFAQRLFYKSIIASEISSESPEHRVLSLLNYIKKHAVREMDENKKVKVTVTRQEIANLTGLRVETVIRAVKALEEKGKIEIIKRKIYI